MAGRLVIPQYMPARDQNGQPLPGAKLFVYVNETTSLATTYTTNALTVANTNPVIANGSGVFPPIWAGNSEVFSVSVTDADGVPYVSYDSVDMSNTESSAAATLAENAAISSLAYAAQSEGYRDSSEDSAEAAAASAAQALAAAAGMGATPPITAIGMLSPAANQVPIYTGPTTAALLTVSPYMQATLGTNNQADLLAALDLGTMSGQDSDDVLITGGQINAVLGGGVPMAASVTKLTFPGTFVASVDPYTMDDYREVAFTPVVTAATTPPTGVTYATQAGTVTKVGRSATITIDVQLSSLGASGVGTVRISVPYMSAAKSAVSVGVSSGTTGLPSGTVVTGLIPAGANYVELRAQSANTNAALDWASLTAAWAIIIAVTYPTA